MRSERGGNIRRRTYQIHNDFPFEVQTGKLIEIFFRNLQAVANKNQRRGKRYRGMRSASADEGVVGKGERFRLAVGDERERGFGFVDFMLVETDRLVEAIRTRGFEASFLELLDSIGLRLAIVEREPTGLNLHHDAMPGQKHVIRRG